MQTKTFGKRIAMSLTGLGLLVSGACDTPRDVVLAERTIKEPVTIRLVQEVLVLDTDIYRLEVLDSKGNQITALRTDKNYLNRGTSFTFEDGRVYSVKYGIRGFEINQDKEKK